MLVIDEAHNIAPAAGANYALESQRTRFIRSISPHFQHRLFLTATPHNGYTESFTSLLELLDDQRFARNILPDEKQLSQVMIRRLKSDLVDADGKVGIDYGVYGVPETYLIDRQGVIRYKRVGPLTPQILQDTLLPLIQTLEAS